MARKARTAATTDMGLEPDDWSDQAELEETELRNRIGFAFNWYNYNYQCYYNSFWLNSALAIEISSNFYYLPKKDKVVLAFLLYIPYFLLAWYDYFANCKFRMNPTLFPFGRFIFLPMKPDPYKRRFDDLDPIVVQNIANVDKYVGVAIGVGAIILILKKYLL